MGVRGGLVVGLVALATASACASADARAIPTLRGAAAIALIDVGFAAATNTSFDLSMEGIEAVAEASNGHCWRTSATRVRCHLTVTVAGHETCRVEAEVLSRRYQARAGVAVWARQLGTTVCVRQ